MRSISPSRAVRNSTGTLLFERDRRQTSKPSMSGRPMSSSTIAGRCCVDQLQAALAGRRLQHPEAGVAQVHVEQVGDVRVVLDDTISVRSAVRHAATCPASSGAQLAQMSKVALWARLPLKPGVRARRRHSGCVDNVQTEDGTLSTSSTRMATRRLLLRAVHRSDASPPRQRRLVQGDRLVRTFRPVVRDALPRPSPARALSIVACCWHLSRSHHRRIERGEATSARGWSIGTRAITRGFRRRCEVPQLAVITEVKRRSPSKGDLNAI